MCIAIVKTKDGKITDDELRNCFESNPDGAGIAYSNNGKLFMIKGIFDENEFIKQYHEAEKQADGAMLIHCRISTSGLKDKVNCHPHVVHDNCVMIHNGILDIDVPKNSQVSDTVIFVNDLLKPLPKDFMLDKGIMNMITHIIGTSNKFCFLNSNGEYAIANEKAGHWRNGVWFSNYSYRDYGYSSWGKLGKKTKYGYYDGYGWQEEDDDDYYKLTLDEREKLEAVILNLTPEQFIKLGEMPVYDFWTGSLRRSNIADDDGERFLADVDEYIAELYEDMYYDAVDKVYEETDKVGELADNSLTEEEIEDYKHYIHTRYTEDDIDDIDEEFDMMYDGYTVKLDDVYVDDDDEDFDDDEDDDRIVDVDYSTEDTYAEDYDDEDEDLTEEEYNRLYNRTDSVETTVAKINKLSNAL